VADWELDVLFRWALVKVDRDGREVGRVTVAGVFGNTHAEQTVVGLDNLAGVLVVGVNAGSMDRSRPFDPDEAPFHAAVVHRHALPVGTDYPACLLAASSPASGEPFGSSSP
jgi:hypothetical protein